MNESDKKRLEEIRDEELRLYNEKQDILNKDERETNLKIYKRVNELKCKKHASLEDIIYLTEVMSRAELVYCKDDMNLTCRGVAVDYWGNSLTIDYAYNDPCTERNAESTVELSIQHEVTKDISCWYIDKHDSYSYESSFSFDLDSNTLLIIFLSDSALKEKWENGKI